MTGDIALWLVQDGVINGAIYVLMALALLLVFAVTRIIFVPQGEFVALAGLTLGTLQLGQIPGTIYLLLGGGLLVTLLEARSALRDREPARLLRVAAVYLLVPAAIAALAAWAAPRKFDMLIQMALTLALVVPLGPMLYRVAYRPLAGASILVLFIASMAVHYALSGLALAFFGGEGLRASPISDARFDLGVLQVSAQSIWVVGASLACMLVLWLFFEHTLYGKALRATAINRVGARIVGIPTEFAGQLAFTVAAAMGALSGILVAPLATIYYDTGLMLGLKGFVGAILGGLGSYPLAALGALFVGLLESFSSFWASNLKETIVFTFIIPVLLWLSLVSRHPVVEDEEE
ncbi:MAG TPA: branched-chain amino acid ABC transporter permease [Burkholderiaceae bacterium]|nr:branched-chain amino acid ABC transporter permease [Burkholderiaceae bacterium]HRP28294.1 branched-chain amino acid ABC transporter permease [Burkholderiaceae bacterium]